jgi:2,3-bisphosphoglycerate-independent phosphoglycerate mutase
MKKVLFVLIDGLGDVQIHKGKTPLEMANTPNMDQILSID